METKYFSQLVNALITIGRFSIVTAITTIARILIDVSHDTITKVEFNGSAIGHIVALLTILFLIIIWFKFEIFITSITEKTTLLYIVFTTFIYIFLITGSAFFSIDSEFINSDLRSSTFLSIGLITLVLSDFFLLINNMDYVKNLKDNYPIKFHASVLIYIIRGIIPIMYLTYLLNSEYKKTEFNSYLHLSILIVSILFAIVVITSIFPKNILKQEVKSGVSI